MKTFSVKLLFLLDLEVEKQPNPRRRVNSLIVKDLSWAPEHEVRQFILGENANLAPCVSMRSRGTETVSSVPYIKSHMPLHQPGSIAEIVIGPTAPSDAEDFACSLLAPFHSDPRSVIRRSAISYSAV